ncbi:MAG: copper-translocating P-type ATPase [Anaerolineaceae bacterium]
MEDHTEHHHPEEHDHSTHEHSHTQAEHDHTTHEQAEPHDHAAMADHSAHDQHILSDAHDHAAMENHDAHAGHSMTDHSGHEEMFRRKFWVSLLLSIPVLIFSKGLQSLLGFTLPGFPGSEWIAPIFSMIVFIYGGVPFIKMAIPELKSRKPGMMTLISLAITVAFVYSSATLFLPGQMDFFWELVTLIDIMLLGHWIEMRSIRQASGALDALAKLMPDTAERLLSDGSLEIVAVDLLKNDDLLLVRPGASIPADGVIVEGESSVNEAMITGESKSVDKSTGLKVIGGSINGDGSLRIRVIATGDQTALAGIMRLVAQAQQSKSRTQILADKAAGWLFYIALGVALLTAIAWTIAIGFNITVIERVATVLVIACPHALGLAIPLVVAITSEMGAKNGILIRDRLALEKVRLVNTILFDKTGTLTEGRLGVAGYQSVKGYDESVALATASAVEGDSEHPIAKAFRDTASKQSLELPKVHGFEALKGRGVIAHDEDHRLMVGGPRLLEMLSVQLPEELVSFYQESSAKGHSVLHLLEAEHDGGNPQVKASFALSDVIRSESKQAVKQLQAMGIKVAIVTGDSEAVAMSVAKELGVDSYFAQVLPENKDAMVSQLQAKGELVAMVGDGINDAPALTRADVGIAIGSGTDVAVESSGIILVRSNPLDMVKLMRLSKLSYRKMIQNLIWAAGYNVIALPLAAGVLAPIGIMLSPAVGALLMSLSTVIVAINSQLMRRAQI